jgi:heat shock protein HslJ
MTTFILKGCLSMKKYKTLTAVLIFVMWIITRIISTAKKQQQKTESGNWGKHLEDGSHVIDDTDSDQSVIEEWDPTILLETPYNIIMIL